MYEEYYGLTEPPFSLTPDPHYFYRSESHNRAHEQLRYGIQRREGFMILYGDIGMGKTTLCRTVLESTDSNVHTALLLNPFLSELDLIKSILDDFGIMAPVDPNDPGAERKKASSMPSKQQMIDLLNEFLLKNNEEGGRAVLLIDEAQNIPLPTLEQIRILSNLETSKHKLMQIVLIGQINLLDVLSRPELRQLYQRISIKCELSPLSRDETSDYLNHRLGVAGGSQRRVSFSPDGVNEIYSYSGGVPRLINLIADRSLLAGMALSVTRIDKKAVTKAVQTLQLQRHPRVQQAPPPETSKAQWLKRAAVTLGISLLLVAIFFVAMRLGSR